MKRKSKRKGLKLAKVEKEIYYNWKFLESTILQLLLVINRCNHYMKEKENTEAFDICTLFNLRKTHGGLNDH
jgi:hypothetical protein